MASKPYQTLTADLIERGQTSDFIEPFDLCKIAAWKSAISVAWITTNSPEMIQEVTRAAKQSLKEWLSGVNGSQHNVITDDTDWAKYEFDVRQALGSVTSNSGLLSLRGVRYPLASAILRVWNPAAFPVVDQHAARAVRQHHFNPEYETDRRLHTASGYTAYARALATSTYFGESTMVHERDKRAMTIGRYLHG